MSLLKQILNEMLLLEDVSIDNINSAIDKHERIIIDYRSVEDEDAGPRVVEVYAYGLTKKGNPVIRGFQPYGNTMTKVPAWKFFLIDGIYNWKPTGQIFEEPAKLFNPNGDETMSVVYKIANFGNSTSDINTPSVGPKTKTNDVYKTDTERKMTRLRNQLDNPINIADLKKTQNGFNGVDKTSSSTNTPKTTNTVQQEPKSDIYKTDTERGMERLRQQLNNPTYISDLQSKNSDIEKLSQQLGDTSEPIKMGDLQQRLSQEPKSDIYKTDTERGMERLHQQLQNPKKIDLTSVPKR